jgi:hypothetical protein
MDKTRRNLILKLVSLFCSLAVVIISASTILETVKKPTLIGLVAGSFGAGAMLASTIREYSVQRKQSEE